MKKIIVITAVVLIGSAIFYSMFLVGFDRGGHAAVNFKTRITELTAPDPAVVKAENSQRAMKTCDSWKSWLTTNFGQQIDAGNIYAYCYDQLIIYRSWPTFEQAIILADNITQTGLGNNFYSDWEKISHQLRDEINNAR